MSVLVLAEHNNAELNPATLNTIAAASQIGGDIHVLVAGSGCGAVADAAAAVAGVAKVMVADAAEYENGIAENMVPLLVGLTDGYSHLLAPATTYGKNILPGVAAMKDVAQISDIIRVDSADTFQRPIYAGNALATVQSGDALKVITVRTQLSKLLQQKAAVPQLKTLMPPVMLVRQPLSNLSCLHPTGRS